jgi:hypothetical protein
MNFYNSEINLTNNNIMLLRYIHFTLILFTLFLHFSFSPPIILDQNHNFDFIYAYNINLIIFINLCYFLVFLSNFISLDRIINRHFLKFIYYTLIVTDFIFKSLTAILNTFAMFEPEFQFLTFYIWNIFLIINVGLSYVYNRFKIYKNKLPGYSINNSDICSICLEPESNWKLPCNHIFHNKCIDKWCICNNTCPYCRQKIR